MPHPAIIGGALAVVLLPTTLVAPLLIAQEAQAAAVACMAGESDPDAVLSDPDPILSAVPAAAGAVDITGDDIVWPVGKGQMGGLHPTGARDMARAMSYPVVAAHAGTVTASADIPTQEGRRNSGGYGSFGRYVVISWKNAKGQGLNNLYAHMRTRVAKQGDTVAAGQLIGYVGSTGNSSGPHLHFELFSSGSNAGGDKTGYDPLPWLSKGREPDVDDLPADEGGEVTAQECQESGGVTADLPTFSDNEGPYVDSPIVMRTKNVGRTPQQAVAWLYATAKRGQGGYLNQCLRLTDDGYNAGGRTGRAIDQWYRAKAKGYAHPNDYSIPVGAQVFFWTSNPARHVGTYIGGGQAIAQDNAGVVRVASMSVHSKGGAYLGWAEPYYS